MVAQLCEYNKIELDSLNRSIVQSELHLNKGVIF